MYSKVLVRNLMIETGKRILAEFDREDIKWTAAFWYERDDAEDEWRLAIATPLFDKIGGGAYGRLLPILNRMDPPTGLTINDVSLMGPSSLEFKQLRHRVLGPASSADARRKGRLEKGRLEKGRLEKGRLAKNHLENVEINDAYVYRM